MDWRLHLHLQLHGEWGLGLGMGGSWEVLGRVHIEIEADMFIWVHSICTRFLLYILYPYTHLLLTSQLINFLSLLHPSSSPLYPIFVERIIKSSDQQASIFL